MSSVACSVHTSCSFAFLLYESAESLQYWALKKKKKDTIWVINSKSWPRNRCQRVKSSRGVSEYQQKQPDVSWQPFSGRPAQACHWVPVLKNSRQQLLGLCVILEVVPHQTTGWWGTFSVPCSRHLEGNFQGRESSRKEESIDWSKGGHSWDQGDGHHCTFSRCHGMFAKEEEREGQDQL